MKKNKYFLSSVIISVVIAMIFGATAMKPIVSTAAELAARKIVVFKKDLSDNEKDRAIRRIGAEKIKHLKAAKSSVVLLSKRAEQELVKNPDVLRIDDDVIVEALVKGGISAKPAPVQPAETLPWGVDRIDAEKVWGTTAGDLVRVGVIDTGIDLIHPDLKDNIKSGYNAINPLKSANDDNGHGTHVAGIVGAIDNTIGVIGVGPKIDLYAVKVLDRNGSGYLSDIIEGLDWAIASGMQIVNMSLGTASNVLSFQEAIQRVNAAGIVQVAAAGNSGGSVSYPAAYSEVIAVSATDKTDNLASWSSRGPEVDLAAPGVSIYSTYKGQTYKTLSGTSMAAPHVTGAAAFVLTTPIGAWDLDSDGIWDPAEVQNKLEKTAEQVTPDTIPGKDYLYGSGLVDAEKAVAQ